MKSIKLLFISLLTFIFNSSSYAQVNFGLKTSLNVIGTKDQKEYRHESKIGFNAGCLLSWDMSRHLLLRTELLYSLKGYNSYRNIYTGGGAVHFSYINMPILLGIRPGKTFTVLAGPELGILTRAKARYKYGHKDLYKESEKFDIGIVLGVSYELNKHIGFDLRYNYGLKEVINIKYYDETGNWTVGETVKGNRVGEVGIHYIFGK